MDTMVFAMISQMKFNISPSIQVAYWTRIQPLSRLVRGTYCCLTRGIVLGLRSELEVGGEEGSWIGMLTGLENGVIGA